MHRCLVLCSVIMITFNLSSCNTTKSNSSTIKEEFVLNDKNMMEAAKQACYLYSDTTWERDNQPWVCLGPKYPKWRVWCYETPNGGVPEELVNVPMTSVVTYPDGTSHRTDYGEDQRPVKNIFDKCSGNNSCFTIKRYAQNSPTESAGFLKSSICYPVDPYKENPRSMNLGLPGDICDFDEHCRSKHCEKTIWEILGSGKCK